MYYHSRPLKYVLYGKVYPPPWEAIYEGYENAYSWLGNYCGFAPQVWLSRSHSALTGWKNKEDNILFVFDIIKGFGLRMEAWEFILGELFYSKDFDKANNKIIKRLNYDVDEWEDDEDPDWIDRNPMMKFWRDNRDLDLWLKEILFVTEDQVVVPSLNLKAAKEIFCRTEREKKVLRKMGFIEDRIKLRKGQRIW